MQEQTQSEETKQSSEPERYDRCWNYQKGNLK